MGTRAGDPMQLLGDRNEKFLTYGSLNEEQSLYRYDEGKWSLKEVLGHPPPPQYCT
jgi:hypothetical protein